MNSPYVPAGSYQTSSIDIQITLQAMCQKSNGAWVQSPPLNYSAHDVASILDIHNLDGTLGLTHAGNPPKPTSLSPYVPAGSYQASSKDIQITLKAMCQKSDGPWMQSPPLSFSASEAANILDIDNADGILSLTKK